MVLPHLNRSSNVPVISSILQSSTHPWNTSSFLFIMCRFGKTYHLNRLGVSCIICIPYPNRLPQVVEVVNGTRSRSRGRTWKWCDFDIFVKKVAKLAVVLRGLRRELNWWILLRYGEIIFSHILPTAVGYLRASWAKLVAIEAVL